MHLVLYFYHNLYLCERNSILETMKTEIIHEMKSSIVHKIQYILIEYTRFYCIYSSRILFVEKQLAI